MEVEGVEGSSLFKRCRTTDIAQAHTKNERFKATKKCLQWVPTKCRSKKSQMKNYEDNEWQRPQKTSCHKEAWKISICTYI